MNYHQELCYDLGTDDGKAAQLVVSVHTASSTDQDDSWNARKDFEAVKCWAHVGPLWQAAQV